MSAHIKQFSHILPLESHQFGAFSLVEIMAHPFCHPTELLSVVNQGGKIKLHAAEDINGEKRPYQFAIVGTGSTIPVEIIDRLYKVGQLILNDGAHGYAVYLVGELRGVAPNGSDAGLTPCSIIKVDVDLDEENSVAELQDTLGRFCNDHSSVIRRHDNLDEGFIELFCYNKEFKHTPEFSWLMSHLYTSQAVDNVKITNTL